ncbi:MAG: repeat domain in Vibrio, Colwellia, Bradyrhizobium and Shewanella [Segetibacter sp.]|nr:repeat domain in Vibrio, Colwellia, Bradyrhizobium and Shewanella [Segetibacter sp.]
MLYNLWKSLPLLALLTLTLAGWTDKNPPLFKLLSPLQTGVNFKNIITENDKLNILNEAYIYNGGGVGIGDFNNDGLADIYFSGNMVSNKLYLNKGALKFQDITTTAGVGGEGRWCTGVSVADINADGWLDIYVCATFLKDARRRINLLYINQGNNKQGIPTFKESAKSYGIADDGYSTQGVFFDYDKDGDLDLYVLTNTLDDPKTPIQFRPKVTDGSALNTDRLYRNNGNETFTNVSKEAGILIEGWGHAVSVSDINKDGYPDIYVSNDFISNDIFYINNKDGTFTNRINDYFKHTSWFTMGTDIVDINNDGLADVVALDMLPEDNLRKKGMLVGNEYYNYFNNRRYNYQHQYVRNVLQLNSGATPQGHPVFNDVGFMAGIYQTDWSWAPLVADFDNDGFRDVVITNGLPRDVTDLDYISFDNGQGGGKVNTSLKMVDALPVVKVPNYAFKNTGGFMFENTTKAWGLNQPSFSNGGAYADLDNDGDLDLVINNINESSFIYENTLSSKGQIAKQHYLALTISGPGKNPGGIGATVGIYFEGNKQLYYEHQPCRGYLSTVDPKAHFGIGAATIIDSMRVNWPDGKSQLITNIKVNQVIKISYKEANEINEGSPKRMNTALFTNAENITGIRFKHQERDAVDYNIQPTLPHKLSQYGPGIAVGDIDNNGFDDFYIAGAAGNKGVFFLQDANAHFTIDSTRINREINVPTEEMGVLLFDADNDKDLDLYVVCGSYEFSPKHMGNQDRLYFNNGKGQFQWIPEALPVETANGSCVRAADFDQDGDLDLFVGGRSVSGSYPMAPRSFLLKNEGGKFTDVTQQYSPQLANPGMITDALWSDFDQDGKTDLVLTGEWMSITFFKNMSGSFTQVNKSTGIDQHVGWWNSLTAGDFDNDGDIDYVAGNLGLNSHFTATPAEPMLIYSKDLDDNGKLDPMVFCYIKAEDGTRKSFPMHTRDDLVSQLVSIRKRYPTYKAFGRASFNELWSPTDRENAITMRATNMNTSYIENKGNGQFTIKPLPLEAQAAPVYAMATEDVDDDGNLDLLLVGNDYGMEPGGGRHDAFTGLCLKGNGNGNFISLPLAKSGFFVNGDAKGLATVHTAKGEDVVVATQNQDSLKVFSGKVKRTGSTSSWITLNPDDFCADLILANNKKRRMEFYYGSTFLSQSSRKIALPADVVKVVITDFKGNKREVVIDKL